jgi:two-component system response regulator (stage 0 sporulation protein F)
VPTILIVEDDATLSSVLHQAFRREWTVELATDARAALETFREAPPDIVLTDKNMPGMNGVELLRAIRKLDRSVGVVVMTAYGTVESASQAFDLGVDAYIEKPFPDLLALVREMDRLRLKVEARRREAPVVHPGAMRVLAVTSDEGRRARLNSLLDPVATVRWLKSLDELSRALADGGCDLTVVDCVSLGADPSRVASVVHAERVPCLMIAEGLSVPEITRLIELSVKALVNVPFEDPRFDKQLSQAVERVKHGQV